jgi:hypothetical protein
MNDNDLLRHWFSGRRGAERASGDDWLLNMQAAEVAEPGSMNRADALVRAAIACLELGDFAQAATYAREGWGIGRRLQKQWKLGQAKMPYEQAQGTREPDDDHNGRRHRKPFLCCPLVCLVD